MAGTAAPSTVQIGWFDKLRNSLPIDSVIQTFHLSRYTFFDIALSVSIGFLCGFLWKRFAPYFIVFVLLVAGLIVLQQFHLVTFHINWLKLQECCGIEPVAGHSADSMTLATEWIKSNSVLLVSFIIGFCFGAKVS